VSDNNKLGKIATPLGNPEEFWKLIQGYIRCAEENKKEAELTFDAQVEAITKADKGEM
jgi:hypothetical protein